MNLDHPKIIDQPKRGCLIVGHRGEGVVVTNEDIALGRERAQRLVQSGDGDAFDRPRHAVADLGDRHLAPCEANRAVGQRAGLFAREGCSLRGGWALAGECVGVMGVGVVAGVAGGSRFISAGLGGLVSPADVGAEVAGVAGAALAGDAKPSAIGAIGSPLQMVAGGPDTGREELGGTAAAAREGAVGVDPHVELDLIISGEITTDRRDADRLGAGGGGNVGFELYPDCGAIGVRGRWNSVGAVVVAKSHGGVTG